MNEKITVKEKICYGMLNMGNIPVITLVSSFLLIFYTNVVGLSASACATLFLVARILDAVNDPFIGFFLDRLPYTKSGHFRMPLLIGSVLCGLNYLLLWLGPLFAPVGKLAIAYVTYILLGFLFPVMDISLNSLLPVMTTDMKERSTLSTIKGAVFMVGAVIINMIAPILIGDESQAAGYVRLVFVVVTIIVGFSVLGALGVKERLQVKQQQKYSVKELLKILTLRPVWTIFLATLLTMVGTYVMNTVNIYFFIYVMGDSKLYTITALVVMLGVFVGLAASQILTPKLGKRKIFLLGTVLYGILPIFRLVNVTSIPLLMIANVITGLGNGIKSPQTYAIQADNTDYVEWKTGQRAEAAIASLSSLTSKFGMGIGGAIPGYLLAFSGFDAKLPAQPAAVNGVLIFCILIAPAILNFISALLIGIGYPLDTKTLKEMFTALEERRK